jgi:CheY-like chemotaxis protein
VTSRVIAPGRPALFQTSSVAASGSIALQHEQYDEPNWSNLLIVDLMLPGMDGLALIAALRTAEVGAPVPILSATSADQVVRHKVIVGGQGSTEPLSQLTPEVDETQIVSAARDLYLGAFERVFGTAARASLVPITIEGELVWRLTLSVSNQLLEDAPRLIELESELHRDVRKHSASYAGFFSLQYVSDDGDA